MTRDSVCSTEEALTTFVACAHVMLDPTTSELVRRSVEPRLIAQLPALRALGVFDLFEIRNPELQRLVSDELSDMAQRRSGT
jgi:hypothetical protein